MSNKIIIVGAGPIGLWTAIQLKLQRPDLEILIHEKRSEYTRHHTLWLSPQSFADCQTDEYQIIESLIRQLRRNPHIRTKKLEEILKNLAERLGIVIHYKAKITEIDRDLLSVYPDATLIIGADSIHSTVNEKIFGAENTHSMPLAYAAQIKYNTQGASLQESTLFETYPLLKQSHYLAAITHGKVDEKNEAPITIQFLVPKSIYDALRTIRPSGQAINLFSEEMHELIPSELLADIKTQIGYRLAHNENILLESVQLTTTALPQQRCRHTTLYKEGHYYGLIGDAALGLSYFQGMNSGLHLATKFSAAIVKQWGEICNHNPNALKDYETQYDRFANTAVRQGYQTNFMLKFFRYYLDVSALFPIQSVYVEPNDIAEYHRRFDIIHQVSQFYLATRDAASESSSSDEVQSWLENQMPTGLVILQSQLQKEALTYQQQQPLLHQALMTLASIDHHHLSLYEKAYLGLAISKTRLLLDNPTPQAHQSYLKFLARLKPERSSFNHICTITLLLIAGFISISLGVGAGLGFVALGIPLSIACTLGGSILFGLGVFHHQRKPSQPPSATCIAVEEIASRIRVFP
ncbi:MAG: hypothetical protein WCR08_02420 [Gammaproteobacteria bacterium]